MTGNTNRFFGKDIVQTTKDIFDKLEYTDKLFDSCKTLRDYFKIIANHFKLTSGGVSSVYYHKFKSRPIVELVDYYNKRYVCNESCSSNG